MVFCFRSYRLLGLAIALVAANNAIAQPAAKGAASLKQAFEAAWQRQPEAQAAQARKDAAIARRQVADSWTAAPPSVELSGKTDQLSRNRGNREYEAGLAVPLWLPGERSRTQILADAELNAVDSRTLAAQLRIAASVREAYWTWQRARIEHDVAQATLANARQLALDVAKRMRAGDLARADQHQAEGAAAGAEAAAADAESVAAQALQQLRALTGSAVTSEAALAPEPFPGKQAELATQHPAVRELADRAEVARRNRDLASVQNRANPELMLAITRERGAIGDPYAQTVTLGVRIPFGSSSRDRARVASAGADQIETEAQLQVERERVLAEVDLARTRIETSRTRLAAAERRAALAKDSRAFFEKSFRLGETDLPTRLRIELEAFEAERQAARARMDAAQAISLLRQTLGLLPE